MKDIIIRDYTDQDFETMADLWIKTDLGNPARGDNLEVINRTLNLGGKLFVMETGKKEMAGCAWITNDGRRLYLHHFGILPEYQGQGLGKQLLKHCLDFAKKNGQQIKLEVHKDNIQAVNLYEKGGFTYLGDYKVYIIREYK